VSVHSIPDGQQGEYLGIHLRYRMGYLHQFRDFLPGCFAALKTIMKRKNLFVDNFIERQQSWLYEMLLVGRNFVILSQNSLRDTRPAPDEKMEYVSKQFDVLPRLISP